MDGTELAGDEMLRMLSALANPHRLRIIAVLSSGRQYVSQLAREIGLSRPLVHMHLRRLESAGLIEGKLELSDEGKAMKYFEVTPFALHLTPERIAEAVNSPESRDASVEGPQATEAGENAE
jgi:ArsR family transcriptional regulator